MSEGSAKLLALQEGDVFELGDLMPGLNSGQKITWTCLENVQLDDMIGGTADKHHRITLHAYWHDVFLMPAVVYVDHQGNQNWSFNRVNHGQAA